MCLKERNIFAMISINTKRLPTKTTSRTEARAILIVYAVARRGKPKERAKVGGRPWSVMSAVGGLRKNEHSVKLRAVYKQHKHYKYGRASSSSMLPLASRVFGVKCTPVWFCFLRRNRSPHARSEDYTCFPAEKWSFLRLIANRRNAIIVLLNLLGKKYAADNYNDVPTCDRSGLSVA